MKHFKLRGKTKLNFVNKSYIKYAFKNTFQSEKNYVLQKTIIFYFWDCLSDLQENFRKNIKH